MELTSENENIGWEKIFALAALDAGIIISWTAYHNFQPKLLTHFHFEHLATFVLVAQSIVMLSIPLMAGLLTDYYRKKTGKGFSVFAVGISVASLAFMAVAFTASEQTFGNWAGVLPVLIVIWLVSMNVFHSPANSILEAFSKSPELPLMMSVLVICKIAIHALDPVLISTLDKAGGAYTFLTGGAILIITGMWFAKSTKNMTLEHVTKGEHEVNRFHWVIFFGLMAGLCNSLILHFFPEILQEKFGGSQPFFKGKFYISIMLAITALATLPLSKIVKRVGFFRSLIIGLLIAFTSMIIILASENFVLAVLASAALAAAYGLVLITAFPNALHNIAPENATFGTGIFFASFEFFEVMFKLFVTH